MPALATFLGIVVVMGISYFSPAGYASQSGRKQKAPGALAEAGMPAWLDRVQGAHYNTYEATIHCGCSFFVALQLGFPAPLLAQLSALFLLIRLAYPIFYALDVDLMRTQLWLTGAYALCWIGFGGLFPATLL